MRGDLASATAAGSDRIATRGLLLATFGVLMIVVFKLHSVLPPVPRPALILSPVALWLSYKYSTAGERQQLWREFLVKAVAAYFVWGIVTIPTSIYRSMALDTEIGLIPLCVMFAALCLLPATRRTVDTLVMFLAAGGALLGLASLAINNRFGGRLAAPAMFDPNDLGAVMAVTGALSIGMLVRTKGWQRWASLGALIVAAVTVTQTSSRGSTIGFGVGVFSVIVFAGGSRRVIGLMLLLVGTALFVMNMPESYKERMASVGDEDYNSTDYYGRKAVWRRGIQYTLSNPVLGVGVGTFQVAEGNQLLEQGRAGKWSNAHNAYVQAFAELGIPGGVVFLCLIGGSFVLAAGSTSLARKKKLSASELRPEILGACLALAVASFFLSFAYFPMWFALWALVCLANRTTTPRPSVYPSHVTLAHPQMRSSSTSTTLVDAVRARPRPRRAMRS